MLWRSSRSGKRVAGDQGGARRFEVDGDVGHAQKRYNTVVGPNSTQHHPTIIVARFNKTPTSQPTNIINNLTP